MVYIAKLIKTWFLVPYRKPEPVIRRRNQSLKQNLFLVQNLEKVAKGRCDIHHILSLASKGSGGWETKEPKPHPSGTVSPVTLLGSEVSLQPLLTFMPPFFCPHILVQV